MNKEELRNLLLEYYEYINEVDEVELLRTWGLLKRTEKFIEAHQELRGEGWISVKYRLPKQATFVIVYKHDGLVLGMYYNADKEFMYGEINVTPQITHWKHLPKAPKPAPPKAPNKQNNET